jgi:hypothetical protein
VRLAFVLISCAVCNVAAQTFGERDTEFEVVLSYHPEKPSGIQADIATTNTYPCEGYRLKNSVAWDKDTVVIHLLGMVRPTPCIQSSSEARGSAFLGKLVDGVHYVRISYRGVNDVYKLAILPKGMKVVPVRNTFTRLRGY